MSTPQSFLYIVDFERRIANLKDPDNEKFVRELIADVMEDCPMLLLEKVAKLVLSFRCAELAEEALQN